jgi:Tol biopolymer transport system component
VVTRVEVASALLVSDDRPLDGVRWAPGGEAIYYLRKSGQSKDLFRIDLPPDGRGPQLVQPGLQIVEDRDDRINLAISDDGVLSFASGPQYANLWHVPFDGSEPRALTTGTMSIRRPVVSPGGDRVAFEAASGGGYDIHVLDLENGGIRRLTTMQTDATSPVWPPSSDAIAFVSAEGGAPAVWLVWATTRATSAR